MINSISIIVLIIYLIWRLNRTEGLLFAAFYHIFSLTFFVVSLIGINQEIYMTELFIYSKQSLSITTYIIYLIIFLESYFRISERVQKNMGTSNSKEKLSKQLLLFFIILLMIIFGYFLYSKGNVFNLKMNKIDYRNVILSKNRIANRYFNYTPLIVFILGYYFTYEIKKIKKLMLVLIFLINLIFYIFVGVKFGEILLLLNFFIMPIFLKDNSKKFTRYFFRNVIIVIIVSSCFLFLTLFMLNNYKIKGMSNQNKKLYSRISNQGQVYYLIEKEYDLSKIRLNEFNNELEIITKSPKSLLLEDKYTSMYKLMELIQPRIPRDLQTKKRGLLGYSLSGGFPVDLLYYFGYTLTIFIISLIGVLYGLLYRELIIRIRKREIFSCLLLVLIFLNTFGSVLIIGGVMKIFNFVSLKWILIYLIFQLIKKIIKEVKINACYNQDS